MVIFCVAGVASIIGGAAGCVALLLLVIVAALLWRLYRQRRKQDAGGVGWGDEECDKILSNSRSASLKGSSTSLESKTGGITNPVR